MDPVQKILLDAAARMGVTITVSGGGPIIEGTVVQPVASQELTSGGQAVAAVPTQATNPQSPAPVDPPEMKPDWEKEIDGVIAQHGGRFEVKLPSGATVRITADPKPAADAVEISHETFKRLSRAAAVLSARVVDIRTRAAADAQTKELVEKGEGFWASPSVFVEVDKQAEKFSPSGPTDFGIIAAPKYPPTTPPVVAHAWLTLSAGDIVEQVPMRVSGGKVIGTLIKTKNGALYARVARESEHRLNIHAEWALSGGYTIEREIYDKYLTEPSTVIKIVRGENVYLTTSAWVQAYGGVIRHWGTERVVMPLGGSFWLVVDKNGEPVQ